MIKNSQISLEPSAKERLNAVNMLRYTLFLEHQTPDLGDMIEMLDNEIEHQDVQLQVFFSSLMKKTQSRCSGLFGDGSARAFYYRFFGFQKNDTTSALACLDRRSPISDIGELNEKAGLDTMILQHCVFSSYHAVLTNLVKDHRVTSYEMANKIRTKGIHSLYKEGKISFTDKGLEYHDREKDASKKNSSRASDFSGKTKTHIRWMPHIMELFAESTGETSYSYRSQFSQICYHICNEIKATDFRFLKYDERKKREIGTLLASIEGLTVSLEPRLDLDSRKIPERIFESFNGDVVDGLYHYYITERVFDLNLFYALAKNIQSVESQTSYHLCQDHIIRELICCRDLPNAFSRQYFLKYAFDSIIDEAASHYDFWHIKDMLGSGSMMSYSNEPRFFDLLQWIRQYRAFMGYMSKFMIPVYEWCFIDMLLSAIEQRYPEKTHTFHLEYAFKMLSRYIEENHRSILQPIRSESEMDLVDIISEHKDARYIIDHLSHDSLRQMVDELIRSDDALGKIDDLELNLYALDPSFFDDRNKNPGNNIYKKLHSLYTKYVWDMCLG